MRHASITALLLSAILIVPGNARAWGADGHRSIGRLAEALIAGSHAAERVHALLGELSLADAAVWADCAKAVDPSNEYRYRGEGRYPECAVFETPAREAEMSDFVRRNDRNCDRKPAEESCHRQYHYTDVPIERGRYEAGAPGTRPDDVVAAVVAASRVIAGRPAPAPFDIRDQREALLLLAHYVGDLHQPLHVGAVYLAADGNRVNSGRGPIDAATGTRGGNQLVTRGDGESGSRNLHALWDAIPAELRYPHVGSVWLSEARSVERSRGNRYAWPARWASETVRQAREAFAGVRFAPEEDGHWRTELPAGYAARMTAIKRAQLTLAAARLAALIEATWPPRR